LSASSVLSIAMTTQTEQPRPRSYASGAANRQRIGELVRDGWRPRDIAPELGLTESYVYRQLRKYRAEQAQAEAKSA
jgi:hypothetical protein